MKTKQIGLGIIGCGLMGRELASAAARWFHLVDLDFAPRVVAVCDVNPAARQWFVDHVPGVHLATENYHELLADDQVEAIYCAVPHNLHQQVYTDVIRAEKHLLGEKPFGIDLAANRAIMRTIEENPAVLVRCSSEFPFYPGAYRIGQLIRKRAFGRIIEVEAGFWHSSDLDPTKPINWKRRVATNGEYGGMGDLGLHVLHMPLRFGWHPANVRALLSRVIPERPDQTGAMVPCETWDNAILACEVKHETDEFPMVLSMKRIAPGHANTWFMRVLGTSMSAEFSTRNPKQVQIMDYHPGAEQGWTAFDVPQASAYNSITGKIFEFGFSDAILQMLAAFLDEVVHGADMRQPFGCVRPVETALSHHLFAAALESQRTSQVIQMD